MTPQLILVVDDEPHILENIQYALKKEGFEVAVADGGQAALDFFAKREPDLVILDINLPDRDGLWVCRRLRETSQAPILFLSARDEEVDRVMGLTIGGDDYVTKPFSLHELVARVRAILRRSQATSDGGASQALRRGRLRLSPESFAAWWDEDQVDLTATQFRLLKTLLARPAKVFTRDEIMTLAYQDTAVCDRTIDSHILHIRKKFGARGGREIIQTQHGVGYKIGDCE